MFLSSGKRNVKKRLMQILGKTGGKDPDPGKNRRKRSRSWEKQEEKIQILGKTGGKDPPPNPQQNSNQNLGASRPKSALQASGLDGMP